MELSKKERSIAFVVMLLCGCLVCMVDMPLLAFGFTGLIFLAILLRAKYSFFSVFAFIMLFSYMQVIIYKETGLTSGMLRLTVKTMPLYYREMTISFVSFFLTELYFVWFTKLLEKEKRLYQIEHELSIFSAYLLIAVAIVLTLLLFPSFPTFKLDVAARRTQGITRYYGFILLALCLAALTIDSSYKHKSLILGYVFIVFWIFGHAERVEALGFLVYYLIKLLHRYSIRRVKSIFSKLKKGMLFIIVGAIGMFGTWIGLTRLSSASVTLADILGKLIIQGTSSDVLYVFNCAIDMWKNGNLLHGYTYLNYLLELIPASATTYKASFVITDYYFTMGGAFFFTEPMMNFGLIWTVLSNIEFFAVMRLLLGRTSRLKAYIWIPIVIEIFRITWYGRSGWILAAFVEMPLMYFGIRYVLNRIRLQHSGGMSMKRGVAK